MDRIVLLFLCKLRGSEMVGPVETEEEVKVDSFLEIYIILFPFLL